MDYNVKSIVESTTANGTRLARASLIQPDGVVLDNVTFWAKSWPIFPTPGTIIKGDYKEEQKGNFLNRTLYPIRTKPVYVKPVAKAEQIAVAQERKAEYIAEAQENKNKSIAFFNATNNAIEITKARLDVGNIDINDYQIQQEIVSWRNFFLDEWKTFSSQPF